jgi:hypothetical protein
MKQTILQTTFLGLLILANSGCSSLNQLGAEISAAQKRYDDNSNADKDSGLIGDWWGNPRGNSAVQYRIAFYEYGSIQEQVLQNGNLALFSKGHWNVNPLNKKEIFCRLRPYPEIAGPSNNKKFTIESLSANRLVLSVPQVYAATGTTTTYHAGYGTETGTGSYVKEAYGDNRKVYIELRRQ